MLKNTIVGRRAILLAACLACVFTVLIAGGNTGAYEDSTVLSAAEVVASEGIDVEVVDLRTLKPLDKETVLESVKKTAKLLIVHEDNLTGGIGAEVAALVADEAFEHLDGPITRLCGPDVPTMPFAQPLEDAYMPNTEKVAEALRKLAAY